MKNLKNMKFNLVEEKFENQVKIGLSRQCRKEGREWGSEDREWEGGNRKGIVKMKER